MSAGTRASISVVPVRGAIDGANEMSGPSVPSVEMRAATLKAGGASLRQPKPRDPRELEKRFTQVLVGCKLTLQSFQPFFYILVLVRSHCKYIIHVHTDTKIWYVCDAVFLFYLFILIKCMQSILNLGVDGFATR